MRPAEAGDRDAVTDLWRQLGHPITPAQVADQLRVHGADRTAGVLVAEHRQSIVGFASYDTVCSFEFGNRIGWLTALVVSDQARQAGVGRALVAEVERLAKGAGCSQLSLTSGRRPERVTAHAFYRSLGFEDTCSDHALFVKQL